FFDLASGLGAVAFGVSLVEGGVRESVALVLDGRATPTAELLGALPTGLDSLARVPPSAACFLGARLDFPGWVEALKAALPEDRQTIEAGIAAAPQLARDAWAAFGDEAALALFPPQGFLPIPEWLAVAGVRDGPKLEALLPQALAALPPEMAVKLVALPLDDGTTATQVMPNAPLPMLPPVFAVRDGRFLAAAHAELLKRTLADWKVVERKTLAKDGEVFAKVVRGLNGGETENLFALAYLDLRALVPVALAQILPRLPGRFVDLTQMPDPAHVARHLSGVALGARRDREGLVVDTFSPTGLLIPLAAAALSGSTPARGPGTRPPELSPDAAYLGIESGTSEGEGVVIESVVQGAPAAAAGLEAGDRIEAVGGEQVRTIADLKNAISNRKSGDEVTVHVRRGESTLALKVKLGRRGDFAK
ncbi:MAG: PDZ domain-containing protein, partial [Planctomycetota bacterium]